MDPIWESKLHSVARRELGLPPLEATVSARLGQGGFQGIRIPQFAFILRGYGAPYIGGLKPSFFHGLFFGVQGFLLFFL